MKLKAKIFLENMNCFVYGQKINFYGKYSSNILEKVRR